MIGGPVPLSAWEEDLPAAIRLVGRETPSLVPLEVPEELLEVLRERHLDRSNGHEQVLRVLQFLTSIAIALTGEIVPRLGPILTMQAMRDTPDGYRVVYGTIEAARPHPTQQINEALNCVNMLLVASHPITGEYPQTEPISTAVALAMWAAVYKMHADMYGPDRSRLYLSITTTTLAQ